MNTELFRLARLPLTQLTVEYLQTVWRGRGDSLIAMQAVQSMNRDQMTAALLTARGL